MKYCRHCGKEIADEAVICMGCGCQVRNYATPNTSYTQAPTENMIDEEPSTATWSKIAGISSFFIGWFALGITAIVLACISKNDTQGIMCPSAKVGYVCGWISTILSLAVFFFIIIFIVAVSV